MRLLLLWLVILVATSGAACHRGDSPLTEASFYGTWVKGNHAGDSLIFSEAGIKTCCGLIIPTIRPFRHMLKRNIPSMTGVCSSGISCLQPLLRDLWRWKIFAG